MLRIITIVLFLLVMSKTFGQKPSGLFHYYAGINFNYAGNPIPDFTFPIGFGINLTVTLNNFSKIEPAIELNVIGFPEYIIPDDPGYAYGSYNFLAGAKYKVDKFIRVSLTAGPLINSNEKILRSGVKPSLEISTKNEKLVTELYYFKIIDSKIINGYIGAALLFKIR